MQTNSRTVRGIPKCIDQVSFIDQIWWFNLSANKTANSRLVEKICRYFLHWEYLVDTTHNTTRNLPVHEVAPAYISIISNGHPRVWIRQSTIRMCVHEIYRRTRLSNSIRTIHRNEVTQTVGPDILIPGNRIITSPKCVGHESNKHHCQFLTLNVVASMGWRARRIHRWTPPVNVIDPSNHGAVVTKKKNVSETVMSATYFIKTSPTWTNVNRPM